MLSSESVSHSDFSSSEEDEMNGTDLNRTLQGVALILQIKELIGRGAFGSVYKATWKGLPAAIKVGCICKMGLVPPMSSNPSTPDSTWASSCWHSHTHA